MNLILLARYWKYIVTGVLAMLLVFTAYLLRQSHNTIALMKSDHELQLTTLKANYVETARDIERQSYEKTIQAVNDAKKREQVLVNNIASANAVVASMSNTVTEVSAAAKLNAELGDRYIDTSRRIITECTSEYSKMGAIAQKLSNDVRLLADANKRK